MPTYTIGEEVLFDDERFVVSSIDADGQRYRLLATTPAGARVVWARHHDLHKMTRYTKPTDDTLRIAVRP
jgi:hypothetical protein